MKALVGHIIFAVAVGAMGNGNVRLICGESTVFPQTTSLLSAAPHSISVYIPTIKMKKKINRNNKNKNKRKKKKKKYNIKLHFLASAQNLMHLHATCMVPGT